MSKMKVYEINSVCGVGSTGRIAVDIKDVLVKNGNSCRIAYGRGFYNDENCYKIEGELEFRVHALLSRITDRQGFYSKSATEKLVADIKAFSPDIIHLHNIHGYYLNIPILFRFLAEYDRPVVWTLHDCWSFTGHCAYFDFLGCGRWKTECHNCPQKKAYPASLLLDNSNKNYIEKKNLFSAIKKLTLVTPSNWLKCLAEQSFLGEARTVTINNGIDLNRFKPTYGDFLKTKGIDGKKIVLGVAGVWEERKGIRDFYKLREMLGDRATIVLVGVTKKQMEDLPKGIVGILRTNSTKELAELYTAADFFVNPTYEDNFPTTNLEALACGTPVITYNTGGSGECIDKTCGAVVEKGDVEKIAELILTKTFSVDACLNSAKRFDKDTCFAKYIKVYEEIK